MNKPYAVDIHPPGRPEKLVATWLFKTMADAEAYAESARAYRGFGYLATVRNAKPGEQDFDPTADDI